MRLSSLPLGRHMAMGLLGRRIVAASSWTLVQMITSLVLRLGSNLVMTRLLLPEAFGLMAMVSTAIAAINLFTDIAVARSIVREPDGDSTVFLQTAWTVKNVRGLGVVALMLAAAAALWLLAPGLAPSGTVYADPRLPGLLAVASLTVVLGQLSSTNQALARRRMMFWLPTVQQLSAQIASIAAMILFARIQASPWALLFGMLTGSLVASVLSHVIFPGPPMRPHWNADVAARLWSFGKWIIGSSALTFLARYADRILLGALLDSTQFGLYAVAVIWVEAGATLIRQITDAVAYPAFSQIHRDRPEQIARLFRRFLRAVDMVCLGGMAAAVIFGPILIRLLYRANYEPAASYVPFLALGYLSIRFNIFGTLILSTGNSRSALIISGSRALALCLGLPLGWTLGGLEGVLIAVALSTMGGALYSIRTAEAIIGSAGRRWDLVWLVLPFALAVVVHLVYGGGIR